MKFSAAILPALVAVASAQSLDIFPDCALKCIQDAVGTATKCDLADFACVCKSMDTLTAAATPCVLEKCGADVALSTSPPTVPVSPTHPWMTNPDPTIIDKVLPATKTFCEEVAAGGSGSSSASSSSSAVVTPSSTSSEAAEPTETDDGDDVESTTSAAPSAIVTPPSNSTTTGAGTSSAGETAKPTTPVQPGAAAGVTYIGSLAMLALGALAAF